MSVIITLLQVWEKAGTLGLLGVNTNDSIGGIGADFLSSVIMWEEQYVKLHHTIFGSFPLSEVT